METKSMLYLVSEYAPNGEIFGNNHLPILILITRPSASESGLSGNDFSSLGKGMGMVNFNAKVQDKNGKGMKKSISTFWEQEFR